MKNHISIEIIYAIPFNKKEIVKDSKIYILMSVQKSVTLIHFKVFPQVKYYTFIFKPLMC